RHGYEENLHRYQDRCRQEACRNENERQEKTQPDRRGLGGFEEKPQTAFMQKILCKEMVEAMGKVFEKRFGPAPAARRVDATLYAAILRDPSRHHQE
ncbi:MAG: hypothetical protein WBD31_03980, partial [Rubripirellula sp.]